LLYWFDAEMLMRPMPNLVPDISTPLAKKVAAPLSPKETPDKPSSGIVVALSALWPWRWYVVAAIVAVGASVYFGPTLILGPKVIGDAAMRAEFLQTVVASGHVEAPFRVDVGAQMTGIVSNVPVEEGQAVKAGDTLIVLDDQELQAAVGQAEGVVAQAKARIRQMTELTLPSAQQTLKDKQATFLNAQKLAGRITRLLSDGFSSPLQPRCRVVAISSWCKRSWIRRKLVCARLSRV
jgi:HlyD family secretion protein